MSLWGDPSARWLRDCDRVGDDPTLEGKPTVLNYGRIEIGCRLHLSSRPVGSHLVSWGLLRIGDDVTIAHGAAIAAARQVSIGDRSRAGAFLVVMDTDFHGERARAGAPQKAPTSAPGSDSGYAPVEIGADVRIGSHVTLLRGATIGDGAQIAAGSVVNGRIPPGALAQGVPARVLGRAGGEAFTLEPEAAADVPAVVMRVFGLTSAPELRARPDDIPGWDSLGALRLLLSLEDAFGITLDPDTLLHAGTIGELAEAVARVRQRRSPLVFSL